MHHGTAEAIPLPHGVKFRISMPETVADSLSLRRARGINGSDAWLVTAGDAYLAVASGVLGVPGYLV
jgi:hypothetical protein